ncbi:hypothetical protein KIH86_06710 [Paenibacillus sp. HN-1]|uniref:hypothetical protein n=1 Tax=Paenibacillus TaxID=44249 RepID=UPI001CAA40BE|nr:MULTISPECIES: hypothetical protein [Paenibacillus]MBY9077968.1 hypothetical protein [Paenibacillus sp. CGMCC 1.18879]MBY9083928.1 hypothetical protein [Paenibacillus sinensis]
MGEHPVRIMEASGGTELIGRRRRIRLRTVGYEQLVRLFSNPQPSPEEAQWLANLRLKLNGEEQTGTELEAYELGDRIILSAGVCPSCLGLQYPIASRFRLQLPAFLGSRKFAGNKLVRLDPGGLLYIQPLPEVAHAECCPLHCSPLEHLRDTAVDEGVLSQELVTAVVKNIDFRFDRYWKLEADFGGRVESFAGLSKRRVLEDMYAYLLEHYYSYRHLSPGLTDQAAYLHFLNRSGAGSAEELERGFFYPDSFAFWSDAEQLLPSKARYRKLKALMVVYHIEVEHQGKLYSAFGEDRGDGLFRVWNQIHRTECHSAEPCRPDPAEAPASPLFRYEDGLSRKFGFSLLGGERR